MYLFVALGVQIYIANGICFVAPNNLQFNKTLICSTAGYIYTIL